MKRLILLLAVLFAGVSNAQITEKDLVGEWKIARMIFDDGTIDIEAGKVDFPEAELQEFKENGTTPKDEADRVLEMMSDSAVEFLPGKRLIFIAIPFAQMDEQTYTLTVKDGATFIVIGEIARESKLTLKGGYLTFTTTNSDGTEGMIEFKKVQ